MCWKVFAAIIAADFLTGLFHWWEDTYGDPRWPIIGPGVIAPNILHHQKPSLIGRMSTFFGRNYQQVAIGLTAILVVLAIAGWWAWPVMLAITLAMWGNEVHTWNHRGKNPWWVRLLQDAAIIQTPRQHALHHRKPYDSYYCALTNITNAVLEATRFWRGLEWLIERLFGVSPKRGSQMREGV